MLLTNKSGSADGVCKPTRQNTAPHDQALWIKATPNLAKMDGKKSGKVNKNHPSIGIPVRRPKHVRSTRHNGGFLSFI